MSRLDLSTVALALSLLCTLFWTDPAFADRRVVLVIGNSVYQHVQALANPAKNAEAMAAMFQKAGFDIVSAQYDAGSSQLKRAIQQFADAAADADIAIVYYAGLGIGINGVNYLIPVDARLGSDRDADNEAISLAQLVAPVDRAKRLRLVIVDACRDNPFARTMKPQRGAAPSQVNPSLAPAEPPPNTLIAYAAKPDSEAEDCYADSSPFTAALLHDLFVRGLDIRLAFGRVREEVLRKTANRQEPYVYGSLRRGGNTALVPSPYQPEVDLQGEKSDYSLVEKVDTARAWEVFLVQHPTGFYTDVARQRLRLAEAEAPPAVPSIEQQRTSDGITDSGDKQQAACKGEQDRLNSLEAQGPNAKSDLTQLEQSLTCERIRPLVIAALNRANAVFNVNTPQQLRFAQQELARLGCYSGPVDGLLSDPTRAAVLRYLAKRGDKRTGNVDITDELVAELTKQSARVCAVDCPAGKIAADGEHCVVAPKPIAGQKNETDTAAKRDRGRQEEKPALTPRTAQQPAGNSARVGVTPGVGF